MKDREKSVTHLLSVILSLLVIGVVLSGCNSGGSAHVQTVATHLSELQKHPFPPHSVGKISIDFPSVYQKLEVEIWSDRHGRTRMEFESSKRKGDYIVTDANVGKSLLYHNADNTYTILSIGLSSKTQPLSEMVALVNKAMESHEFKYKGTTKVAGEEAYKIEIVPKDPYLIGFNKITCSVDVRHWVLLSLDAKAPEVRMAWRAEIVDFDFHPDESLFALTPPSGAREVQPAWQKGTRVVDLQTAKKILGRKPLVPGWLPDGYVLSEMRAGSGDVPSIGFLYSKMYLMGVRELTITETPVHGNKGPLGIDNCKNETVQVHGTRAVYSRCGLNKTLMWYDGDLQIIMSGFEDKVILLKIAESMK